MIQVIDTHGISCKPFWFATGEDNEVVQVSCTLLIAPLSPFPCHSENAERCPSSAS